MDAVDFLAHWVDRATIAWPADLAPDPTAVTWELWAAPAGGLSVVDGVVAARRAPAVRIAGLALDPSGLTVRQLEVRGHLAGYLALRVAADRADIERALLGQVAVLQRGPGGEPRLLTGVQLPGVLDDLYADAARASTLGPSFGRDGVPTVRLWAPTATGVRLLLEQTSAAAPGRRWHAPVSLPMARGLDGVWSVTGEPGWRDARYRFAVTVYAPSVGAVVTSKVTDPYSVGLTVNSTRSVLVDLADPALAPAGWTDTRAPRVERRVDRAIYELHIRDFSAHDETVPEELRGTYSAFTVPDSDGMTRLAELAAAGMNTVHLLPCFDIATIEEDRARQRVAVVPRRARPTRRSRPPSSPWPTTTPTTGATTPSTTRRPRARTPPPTARRVAPAPSPSARWWARCTAPATRWSSIRCSTTPPTPGRDGSPCSTGSCPATTTASTPGAPSRTPPAATTPPRSTP
ncbi:hypothetical protein [Tessaracoccus defluvii]|uniref:hypothetical protein n=1 Tax=Tessaracoccus defluvii TaxID=1285901 RepID=UPI001D0590F9|nr:hypothetical protein [Tessaracoccus defluvii]